MRTLGLSCFCEDPSAVIVNSGIITSAVSERQLVGSYSPVPVKAIEFCLANEGLNPDMIDCVAFSEQPMLEFINRLKWFAFNFPFSFRRYLNELPEWLGIRLGIRQIMSDRYALGGKKLFIPNSVSIAEGTKIPFLRYDTGKAAASGCALFADCQLYKNRKYHQNQDIFIGPDFYDSQIIRVLKNRGIKAQKCSESEVYDNIYVLLISYGEVAVFQGRAEFCNNSAGNRSVLFTEEYSDGNDSPITSPVSIKNPNLLSMSDRFEKSFGKAGLIHSSFRDKNGILVTTPSQAAEEFIRQNIPAMVIGNVIALR